MTETNVQMRHAFRNAVLPLITLVGLSIPQLFGGAVVIESVFGWPGIGSLLITSAQNRDYTVVMGLAVFFSVDRRLCEFVDGPSLRRRGSARPILIGRGAR